MQRISPATFVDTTRKKKFVIFFPFFAPSRGQSSIISGPPAVDSLTFSFFLRTDDSVKLTAFVNCVVVVVVLFSSLIRDDRYTPPKREKVPFV